MITQKTSNFPPVMVNFVQPKAVEPILYRSSDSYYDYQKQTTIYMGGGGGNGGRTSPYRTERRQPSGSVLIDTAYGD